MVTKMKKLFLVILSFCLLVGCQSKISERTGQWPLPKNAKKVADMGNNWLYFEIEVGGKIRKFIFISRHNDGSGDRCIVELR